MPPTATKGVRTQVATFHKRGYAVCGEMYQTLFETAWLMRDMQAFLMDMMLNEELTHAICERIAQIRVGQARQYALAGVDILRLGDDIVSQQGLMFSKELYNTYFKPRIKRIVAAAKEVNPDIIIFMHSCGKIEGMIDELIDAGVEVLNPVQPECNDQQAIKRTYGDRLSFWGGVGVQSVLPHGTPSKYAPPHARRSPTLGPENGFLVAPAHILDPAIRGRISKRLSKRSKNSDKTIRQRVASVCSGRRRSGRLVNRTAKTTRHRSADEDSPENGAGITDTKGAPLPNSGAPSSKPNPFPKHMAVHPAAPRQGLLPTFPRREKRQLSYSTAISQIPALVSSSTSDAA